MNARLRGALVAALAILLVLGLAFSSARLGADVNDVGTCAGQSVTLPFTDVPGGSLFFCAIGSAFFSGLVNGTSPTTYNPAGQVTRDQMAAFVARTQDSAVRRASRRAAAGQWAVPRDKGVLKMTSLASGAGIPCFDGEDVWAPDNGGTDVARVHASDGKLLSAWTGGLGVSAAISAAGYIFAVGVTSPGRLYRIDPASPPGAMTQVAGNLGDAPRGAAFDGLSVWTADQGSAPGFGSLSRYNVVTNNVTKFGVGFDQPVGIVFDGTHLWVVDDGANALLRVDPATGGVLQSLPMGDVETLSQPVFDGSNVWVPVTNALQVVKTSTPAVLLATLTGNGLGEAGVAAFDGERILVAGTSPSGASASLWRASSLAPLGNLDLGATGLVGAASDGLHFWIVSNPGGSSFLMRF